MSAAGIRHEAFFAALGKMPEDNPRWPSLLAALVTLRLIHEWLAAHHVPAEMLAAVNTTLDTVPAEDPSRVLISDLLAPIASRAKPNIHAVAAPLLAYARALEADSRWTLADDLYTTTWLGLINGPHATDADLNDASGAALRAGMCRRLAGDLTGAEAAFMGAHALAMERGDEFRARMAEIGLAKVAQMRGNLPAAEAALHRVIEHTASPLLADVRARAYHDLGVALFWREAYDPALEAYYQSLANTREPDERIRIIADIGSVLGELGCVAEARLADLLVLQRSKDTTLQGAAAINLIELARVERNPTEFERYRALVEQDLDRLPIKIQVDYHYTVGLGFETFGDDRRALEQYDHAIALAETHSLGQELYRIDCARDTLVDGLSNVIPPVAPPALPWAARLGQALERESAAAR